MLRKGKANLFLDGNPVVFTNAIDRIDGEPQTGDAVVLADWKNSAVAWGVYNAASLFKCRILQLDREVRPPPAICWHALSVHEGDGSTRAAQVRAHPACAMDVMATVKQRLQDAVQLRADLRLPREDTNVYRLVNSEGDRLSGAMPLPPSAQHLEPASISRDNATTVENQRAGLIVDVLDTTLVVISSALWVEHRRSSISRMLLDITGAEHLAWRCDTAMLAQETGQRLPAGRPAADLPPVAELLPEEENVPNQVRVLEAGVQYVSDPMGQKTGFYADQRDNRLYLRSLVRGKRVLDLCCYSGGFGINAALHGATEVLGIDSSKGAIALATRNAELNAVSATCASLLPLARWQALHRQVSTQTEATQPRAGVRSHVRR